MLSTGYFRRRSSTASEGAALIRRIVSKPRPMVAACSAVTADGSVVATETALNSPRPFPRRRCVAKMAMIISSKHVNLHSRNTAVCRINIIMASARSCPRLAPCAASASRCPRSTPSAAMHALGCLTWRKYAWTLHGNNMSTGKITLAVT